MTRQSEESWERSCESRQGGPGEIEEPTDAEQSAIDEAEVEDEQDRRDAREEA